MRNNTEFNTIVIGGGISGMSTAARLQTNGLKTLVLEAHGQIGGCAGFFRKNGFAFDVGATTLVDFESNGVGGELLYKMGFSPEMEKLNGYKAWLPDRDVDLYSVKQKWDQERIHKFGQNKKYQQFWEFIDKIATKFWDLSRKGVKLPITSPFDILSTFKKLGLRNLQYLRYLFWTMEDALKKYKLEDDKALRGLLGMLIEDTVHSTVENAPLINSCLGITIRGAGLSRAKGGMFGFWNQFESRYVELGGIVKRGHKVVKVKKLSDKIFEVVTNKGKFYSTNVVSAVPLQLSKKLVSKSISDKFEKYIKRDQNDLGGAIVVFLGVPEDEVVGQEMTHHQLMYDYNKKLGNGNNMFISVSSSGDTKSAPQGYRSVMISTHCELSEWEELNEEKYNQQKEDIKNKLILLARRVYPNLGSNAIVEEVGTPRTYKKFTHRPRGAVGGVRQKISNSNLNAVPHWFDDSGFYQVGDTTWPGLGTVAGVLGARIVEERIMRTQQKTKKMNYLKVSNINLNTLNG